MTLGFLGVGHIASALISGFCTLPRWSEQILVSPRNPQRSADLAERFPQVTIAANNQAVVDGSDHLFIALRPQIAAEALLELRFSPKPTIVSLMAMVPMSVLQTLLAPARHILRAVPMPSVAQHRGPIPIWPSDPAIEALLGRIGTIFPVDREAALHALWTTTALAAPYYGFLGRITAWLARQGLPLGEATNYVAALVQAMDEPVGSQDLEGFNSLAAAVSTKGGLNEQAARELDAAEWLAALDPVLDRIRKRLEGMPTPPATE
jgi:pyrroline-5-carboxylate reductase